MEQPSFSVTLTREAGFAFSADFGEGVAGTLTLDEPAPLGEGEGPNAVRVLAAAIGHCLSASLLFCFRKARIEPQQLVTTVEGRVGRNAAGRLRVLEAKVRIEPTVTPEERDRMARCLEVYEDFCIVTGSVREGMDVAVEVRPLVPEPAAV